MPALWTELNSGRNILKARRKLNKNEAIPRVPYKAKLHDPGTHCPHQGSANTPPNRGTGRRSAAREGAVVHNSA